MSAFDELTLGEVETLTEVVLKGTPLSESDPLMLAGGVMWLTARKTDPTIEWEQFKHQTKMGDIKAFSIQMQADELDPLGQPETVS